jgi:hypothetical protein
MRSTPWLTGARMHFPLTSSYLDSNQSVPLTQNMILEKLNLYAFKKVRQQSQLHGIAWRIPGAHRRKPFIERIEQQ